MRTDRRSPDAGPVDKEAEADIEELDKLIGDATPSVVAESRALTANVDKRVAEVRSIGAVDDQVLAALHETDVSHGTMATAGALVAAAAMGAAHGRGERVSGWPTFDGIVARAYWQRVAGWTDEEYAKAVKDAKERAYSAHSNIVLEHAGRVSDKAEEAKRELSRTAELQHTLHEVELLGELTSFAKEDEARLAEHRAALVADAEPSAAYALQKYTTQLGLAEDDDVLVYVTKDDGKVRPNHRALHMKAWPAKSPVWRRIYPPNGLHCRCTAVRRSRAWAGANLKPEAIRTTVPKGGGPDKGFSRDPRARRRTDTSKYRPAHVSALAGAMR